jgi:hypothetical protein
MGKFLDSVLDRVFAVIGALIFSQAPAFIQQYIQRLAGSAYELKLQAAQINQIATNAGLSVAEYIDRFKASNDQLFQAQGDMVTAILERHATLSQSLTSLENSTWMTRPFTFAAHFNSDLFYGTLKHFTPAVNVTIEGIAWAFIGLLFGYFLYNTLKQAVLGVWGAAKKCLQKKKSHILQ